MDGWMSVRTASSVATEAQFSHLRNTVGAFEREGSVPAEEGQGAGSLRCGREGNICPAVLRPAGRSFPTVSVEKGRVFLKVTGLWALPPPGWDPWLCMSCNVREPLKAQVYRVTFLRLLWQTATVYWLKIT